MHDVGLELPLTNWFTFRVPPTTVPPDYIEAAIADTTEDIVRNHALVVWPGHAPTLAEMQPRRERRAGGRVKSGALCGTDVCPSAGRTSARPTPYNGPMAHAALD